MKLSNVIISQLEINLKEQICDLSDDDIQDIVSSGRITTDMVVWLVENNMIDLTMVLGKIAMNRLQSTVNNVVSKQ